ncbi:hypothetical protein AB0J83_24050 [Actinoplanes sp. NPDC049596]|uniref:hypothetical protein n=1 Tax=unclassified Actinoplanes TaxID=2626549 RepID=UPI003439C7D6
MGIDLELADVVVAFSQMYACRQSGRPCEHRPNCTAHHDRLVAEAAAARPGEEFPTEFRYRRFHDIVEKMELTGMGGIPSFKLLSNGPWLVTAQEIDEALAAYAQAPTALRVRLEIDPRWAAWLAWLAVARDHGGFEAE